MSVEVLRESIMRSPHSWKGISLFFSNGGKLKHIYGDEARLRGDLLLSNDKCEVLVGKVKPDNDKDVSYFPDIASSWSEVYVLLGGDLRNVQHDKIFGQHLLPVSSSILVVEDEPVTSRMIVSNLEKYGNILIASNAHQAIAEYNVLRPDIVFLDLSYNNYDFDGFDVLESLLATNPDAYIVIVSGNSQPATILEALTLGAKGFISKPFKKGSFIYYLERFAAKKQSAV